MKTTKVLLNSFVLAGLLAGCSNEEFTELAQKGNDLGVRPQINLTLSTSAETRMGVGVDGNPVFTTNDVLGAVLVDNGYTSAANNAGAGIWNNIDWNISDGHVGNNKWSYDGSKFKTDGTTAVGAWLFYTKYNEQMTTTRNGVEFYFPQIQEGAATLEQTENNNANFMISPILAIDGYEGENLNLAIKYASVFNRLNIKLDFSALSNVTKIQKIVLSATDNAGNPVKFPTKSKVKNSNVPVAELSLLPGSPVAVSDLNSDTYTNLVDQNLEIERALRELAYANVTWSSINYATYQPLVESADPVTDVESLVLDCDANHNNTAGEGGMEVTDGKFSAFMLVPAGIYKTVKLEIYTNDGVYRKVIEGRDAYVVNRTTPGTPSPAGLIFLRPQFKTSLADVEGKTKTTVTTDPDYGVSDYLPIVSGDAIAGNVVTKTADLINLINGLTASNKTATITVLTQAQVGDPDTDAKDDAAIPAHSAIINKAVMDAIKAKRDELGDGIQITIDGSAMNIYGESEEAPLELRDIVFNAGATLVSGVAKVMEDISIPALQTLTVASGSKLTIANAANSGQGFVYTAVANNGDVVVDANAVVSTVTNNGTLTINEGKSLTNNTVNNFSTLTNNGEWTVEGGLLNGAFATIINNGGILLKGDGTATSTNNGAINNAKSTSVIELTQTVNSVGTITNVAGAKIISGKQGIATVGGLNNSGTITNYGQMYCLNGNHTINNTGTIDAIDVDNVSYARTYITTNSSADLTVGNGVNQAGVDLGEVKISHRDADMTVAKTAQQGRISWEVPSSESVLVQKLGDKFNMIYLSAKCDLSAYTDKVLKYVTVKAGATNARVTLACDLIEFKADEDATIYVNKKSVSNLKIAGGKTLTVPTGNVIGVYAYNHTGKAKAIAEITNNGTMLVGGKCYSTISNFPALGVFASGSGVASDAYFWNDANYEN